MGGAGGGVGRSLGGAWAEPRGQTTTVTVTGEWVAPSPGMTREQTMRAAKDSARALAVEQAAGVDVGAAGLYEAGLERMHFLQTLARGHIVREDVVRWENKNFALAETDPPSRATASP